MKIPIRGRDNFETLENISIVIIFLGVVLFGSGILVSIYAPRGLAAVLSMFGAFLIFIFTVVLVLLWFFKERSD